MLTRLECRAFGGRGPRSSAATLSLGRGNLEA